MTLNSLLASSRSRHHTTSTARSPWSMFSLMAVAALAVLAFFGTAQPVQANDYQAYQLLQASGIGSCTGTPLFAQRLTDQPTAAETQLLRSSGAYGQQSVAGFMTVDIYSDGTPVDLDLILQVLAMSMPELLDGPNFQMLEAATQGLPLSTGPLSQPEVTFIGLGNDSAVMMDLAALIASGTLVDVQVKTD